MTKARKAILAALKAQLISAQDVKAAMHDNWADVTEEEFDNACERILELELEIAEFDRPKSRMSTDTRALIHANVH